MSAWSAAEPNAVPCALELCPELWTGPASGSRRHCCHPPPSQAHRPVSPVVGVSVLILLYVPLGLQRRFITGLHVPLALLAAFGLEQAHLASIPSPPAGNDHRSDRRLYRLDQHLCAPGRRDRSGPGSRPLGDGPGDGQRLRLAAGEHHLDRHRAGPARIRTVFPAWAGNRVVYGHPFETIEAEAKEAEAAHFFGPDATTAERRALLDRYGVRYVYAPLDSALDPAQLGLAAVWTGDGAVLYRVEAAP